MQIANNTVVSFDYTLTNPQGEVIDSSKGQAPLTYLHGAGNIIPGLESQMLGKQPGDAFVANVPAAQAYGERREDLVQVFPRTAFPVGVEIAVGTQFQAQTDQGHPITCRVVNVGEEQVTIDANHQLAGVPLTFDVKVVDVRAATEEEIAHGHVHGPGGHHH